MHHNFIDNKVSQKEIHTNYQIEVHLVNSVREGDAFTALAIYNEFFSKDYSICSCNCKLRSLKNLLISLSGLFSYEVIQSGVAPYDAKAKNQAFIGLIEGSTSIPEVIKIGQKIIKGYCAQVSSSLYKSKDVHIAEAMSFIHNNIGEELTLEMVSEHVKLSKCYFCTLFKKETGLSFSSYLNQTRIEKSKFLLVNTDKPILDISILLGFSGQSYFSTQFKKLTGLTPKKYRNNKQQKGR